jgi:hypothetical protein
MEVPATHAEESTSGFIEFHDIPGGAETIETFLACLYSWDYSAYHSVEDLNRLPTLLSSTINGFIFADRRRIPGLARSAYRTCYAVWVDLARGGAVHPHPEDLNRAIELIPHHVQSAPTYKSSLQPYSRGSKETYSGTV